MLYVGSLVYTPCFRRISVWREKGIWEVGNPTGRLIQAARQADFSHGAASSLPEGTLGGSLVRSVYLPCTSLGRIRRFYRFSRLVESVSYAESVGLRIPTPPASTIYVFDFNFLPHLKFGRSQIVQAFSSVFFPIGLLCQRLFQDAQYCFDLLTVDHFSWSIPSPLQPLRKILELNLVLGANVQDLNLHRSESVGRPFVTLHSFQRERDGFKEGRRADVDGVSPALKIGDGDAARANWHRGANLAYSLFHRHDLWRSPRCSWKPSSTL